MTIGKIWYSGAEFVLALLFVTLYHQGPAWCEGMGVRFVRDDVGLVLSYPPEFSPVTGPSPQVLLLLRPSGAHYPTLNILKQAGDPKVEDKSVSQLQADVVDSYRAVGLYDAEIMRAEKRTAAGRTVFYAEVAYSNRSVPVIAGVYLVPARGLYFVVTFIDTREGFGGSRGVLEGIMGTLALRDPPPPPSPGRDVSGILVWLGGIFGVLIGAKVLVSLFRRRNGAQ